MKKSTHITIPKGMFCGNCSSCVHSNPYNKDNTGRQYCGYYGKYFFPNERNGCFNFKNDR